jgi:hypothetical protein
MEASLRNRAVQTYLRPQTGTKVNKVGLCYIKNINKCCVTGDKRLDSSRQLKFSYVYKERSSVMLDEIDSEQTSTNGMKRLLSLKRFVDNFDIRQADRQLRTREHIGTALYVQVMYHK